MRDKGKFLMSLGLMAVAAGVIVTAVNWPFRTALFPVSVGIFLFLGAMADFLLNLFGKKEMASGQGAVDFQLSEDVDPALARRRTLLAFAWIIGFFWAILFFGFPVAIPLMVFFFLKVQSKERWGISLLMTGVALIFFLGLFVWVLNIPFPAGWIVEGIKTLWIGR